MTTPDGTSRADVATDAPDRYAKQLASHLGRKVPVVEEQDGVRVHFEGGDCLMTPAEGTLLLLATASSEEVLDRIEGVVGRHLEKFGTRAGLTVRWERS